MDRKKNIYHRIVYRDCLYSSSSSSLNEDCSDDNESDTLESLSDLLSTLLLETSEQHSKQQNQQSYRQRELLTSRLCNNGRDSGSSSGKSPRATISIRRTHVQPSTIPGAGLGLFASEDCPAGTLLTCYPGDALVDLEKDGITWGSHAKTNATFELRQEYMLRAVVDHWGIVAVPELEEDPSYRGHFANDGADRLPTSEADLATYVIDSSNKANAEHQPCQGCHMVTLATREIHKGEEVFVTYGPDYWREQESFVAADGMTTNRSLEEVDDEDYGDCDFFDDDEDLGDDSGFDHDYDEDEDSYYYDDAAEAILADIISSEESSESSASSSRGKGFG